MEEKYQRKLQILMKNEGISQSRLAEMLEVKPSTLSHILAGRNYPGFDMLQKLRRLFPHINADWLLLDTSEDYLADAPTVSAASGRSSGGGATDDAATVAARGALGYASRSSADAAGRIAATASGRWDAAAGSATGRIAGTTGGVGTAGGLGAVGNTRAAGESRIVGDRRTVGNSNTVGSAAGSAAGRIAGTAGDAGAVRGARTVGSGAGAVGRTGAVGGGDAQGMAAEPSLFDVSPMSDVPSAGTDAASSAASAQMFSPFDRADGVRIRRIIVLYEDNSFESFTPRL